MTARRHAARLAVVTTAAVLIGYLLPIILPGPYR